MVHDKNDNNQSFREWRLWIREELKRHAGELVDIKKTLTELKVEIAMLKVKSGIWGFAAGAIPVLIMIAVKLLTPE